MKIQEKRFYMKLISKTYGVLLISVALLFALQTSQAQDTTYVDVLNLAEDERVQWVNQIPTLKQDAKRTKKGWFKNFICKIGHKKRNISNFF